MHPSQICSRLQNRSRLCLPASHGSSPRTPRRLGGRTLEALTGDRGGGARRARRWRPALGGGSFVDDFRTPGTESQRAIDVLDAALPGRVRRHRERRLRRRLGHAARARAAGRDRADRRRRSARQPHVTGAPSRSRRAAASSRADGRIAFVPVQYDDTAPDARQGAGRAARAGVRDRRAAPASRSRATAPIVDQAEQSTAPVGELIGVAVAIIVLTLVFRSVAAMAADADLLADRARRRPAAAPVRQRVRRLPQLRARRSA